MKTQRPRLFGRSWSAVPAVFATVVLLLASAPARPQSPAQSAATTRVLAKIDEMIGDVERIMGLKALAPIPRSLLSREEINELISGRMSEEAASEDIGNEERFLEMFGFVDQKFDLAQEVVNTLTEQATALYDYKTKQLYLSTWTPEDMQEFALVHELAHAIADQHFDLGKYVDRSKSADGDLARSAVIEGQASWVMTEWVMQQTGRSLRNNGLLAAAAAGASRFEVAEYPVFSSQPMYLREAMLFPYTEGMIFQQKVIERYGQQGFERVFRTAPSSTQQILNAESYFTGRVPSEPKLPRFKLRGYRRASRGDVGQFDHAVLLEQHIDEKESERMAPLWRGGRYEIWSREDDSRAVLRYASDWADADAARTYFDAYRRILRSKWERMEVSRRSRTRFEGAGSNGRFIVTLDGVTVTSLEGLPDDYAARDNVTEPEEGDAK
jgi:hypothetical protein